MWCPEADGLSRIFPIFIHQNIRFFLILSYKQRQLYVIQEIYQDFVGVSG